MIYCIIAILLIAFVYIYDMHTNTRHKLALYWGMCVLLTLVAGLRYRLGIDTIAYTVDYESIPKLSKFFEEWRLENLPYEFGSSLFFSVCKTISDSWLLPQFLIALITNIAVFQFVIKNTKYPFIVILFYFLIFYFDICFETLRQALALSVALYAFEYLKTKSYWKYYALCIIALLFHNISIVLFVVPLLQFKFNYKVISSIALLCFLLTGVMSTLFQGVFELINVYGTEMMQQKADVYINGDDWGFEKNVNRTLLHFLRIFVLYILPIVLTNFLFSKCKEKSQYTYFTPFILIWSISIALQDILPITYRIKELVQLIVFVIFAEIILDASCNKVGIRKLMIIYTFACMILYWNYERFIKFAPPEHTVPRIVSYYPYASYITENTDANRERFYRESGKQGSN